MSNESLGLIGSSLFLMGGIISLIIAIRVYLEKNDKIELIP